MKKILVIIAIIFLCGCATMRNSEWYDHPVQYASWDHAKFSIAGYRDPNFTDLQNSEVGGWWGIAFPVEYIGYEHLLVK